MRVKQLESEFNEKYENQSEENKRNEHRIEKLLNDFNQEVGFTTLTKALQAQTDGEMDWYIFYTLSAISNFSECYQINEKHGKTDVCEMFLEQQLTRVNDMLVNIGAQTGIRNIAEGLVDNYISKARNFKSRELNRRLSLIQSKLTT